MQGREKERMGKEEERIAVPEYVSPKKTEVPEQNMGATIKRCKKQRKTEKREEKSFGNL